MILETGAVQNEASVTLPKKCIRQTEPAKPAQCFPMCPNLFSGTASQGRIRDICSVN